MHWDQSSLEYWLQTTLGLAHKAGAIIKENWQRTHVISHKEASIDLVTEVDKASEEAILEDLKHKYPRHGILAEEMGAREGADNDFLWIIDPLDGTTNFTHHYPMIAVSIALLHQNIPIVGVVYNPILNEMFHASKGMGAFLNGEPIRVSTAASLDQSLLATGFAYDRRTHKDNNYAEFCSLTHCTQGVRRGGSAALDLAYVAAGRFDGYWERGIKPWDIAAGILLVQEAGGKVTDYDLRPLDLYSGFILASNGQLHPALSQKIMDVRKAPPILI